MVLHLSDLCFHHHFSSPYVAIIKWPFLTPSLLFPSVKVLLLDKQHLYNWKQSPHLKIHILITYSPSPLTYTVFRGSQGHIWGRIILCTYETIFKTTVVSYCLSSTVILKITDFFISSLFLTNHCYTKNLCLKYPTQTSWFRTSILTRSPLKLK